MKYIINTSNKIITLFSKVSLKCLFNELNKRFPNNSWEEYTLTFENKENDFVDLTKDLSTNLNQPSNLNRKSIIYGNGQNTTVS